MIETVLILGGTAESRQLHNIILNQMTDLKVEYSISGSVSSPAQIAPNMHVGGFGGIDGLADFLVSRKIDAVIDATHPFAAQISAHAEAACTRTNVPRLRLDRPQWVLPLKTDAVFVPDAVEAANLLVRTGSEAAFLTIGKKMLGAFAGLDETRLLVRMLEAPKTPLDLVHHTIVTGRPPFTVEDEEALMRKHHIDTLVTKASGGESTRAKLEAAERVRARIILIRRPVPPDGERVFSIDDAINWLKEM